MTAARPHPEALAVGFRVLGFWGLGLRVLGFRVLDVLREEGSKK